MPSMLSLYDLKSSRARQLQQDESSDARQFGDTFLTLDELKKQHEATQAKMDQQQFENTLKTHEDTRANTQLGLTQRRDNDAHTTAADQHVAAGDQHSVSGLTQKIDQNKIDADEEKGMSTAVEQTVRAARARGAKGLHDMVDMPDLQAGLSKFEGKGNFPQIEAEFKKQQDAEDAAKAKMALEAAQANKANRLPVPKNGAGATGGERKSADEMLTGMINKAQTGDINWGAAGKIAENKHFPEGWKSTDRMDLDSQAAQLTGEWANLIVQTKRMPNKAEMEMIRDRVLPTLDSSISRDDYVHRLQDVQARLRRIQADEGPGSTPAPGGSPKSSPAAAPAAGTAPAPAPGSEDRMHKMLRRVTELKAQGYSKEQARAVLVAEGLLHG